jgi:hypothetical protein
MTGVKQILFNAYVAFSGDQAKAFDTEEAKEWLVS